MDQPLFVVKVFPHGAIEMKETTKDHVFKVNGHRLKHFLKMQCKWDVGVPFAPWSSFTWVVIISTLCVFLHICVMQEHKPKETQGINKPRRTKIKGPFRPYSHSQAPGFALVWRPILEDQTRPQLDESYFVGLPNMSIFTGSKVFWIIYQAFCWRRPSFHLSQIWP